MAESNYNIQYDAQGRPFFWVNGTVGGAKRYVSPVAMGGDAPEDTTGIFRQRPQWNQDNGEFETPIDWGNILNVGVGSALGLGGLHAAGAFGGAAGGAGAAGSLGEVAAGVNPTVDALMAGAGGGGLLGKILKGLIPVAGAGLAAKAFGSGGSDGAGDGDSLFTPEMERYRAMSEARFRRTDPLHEAVSQLAFQRMPIQSRAGLSLPRVPLPE